MKPVKTGILGCGKIAPAYLRNLTDSLKPQVDVVACADLMPDLAQKLADEFGIARPCAPDALLADPEIELVVNLTPAPAHHSVNVQVLKAGKHLFTEKPLALSMDHVREIRDLAAKAGLQLGGAADTFLGASLQLARSLIDEGKIGTPIAATALVTAGAFNRERYHKVFRGVLLDLGPYYLTALVSHLGPVSRAAACAEIRFPEKKTEDGTPFKVDIATAVAGALEFADGTVGSIVASGDVDGYFPRTEIHGTKGTLVLADANQYEGDVIIRKGGKDEETFTPASGFSTRGRGLGVAEMAMAIRENRPARTGPDLIFHVTEIMLAMEETSRANRHSRLESTCARPSPFAWAESPKT